MARERDAVRGPAMGRREFLAASAGAAVWLAAGGLSRPAHAAGPFALPKLPYPEDALHPVISSRTVGVHHGKHHRAYVDNLNKLVAGTEYEGLPLEQVVRATAGQPERAAIFNNAAQAWNHGFYWCSLKPKGGGAPPAALRPRLEAAFGSVEACRQELEEVEKNLAVIPDPKDPHNLNVAVQLARRAGDIDTTIAFYRHHVGLHVVHDRCDNGVRVAWLSEEQEDPSFVVVVIGTPPEPRRLPVLTEHLGYDLPSREAVDEVAARAAKAGVLAHGPVDLGPIVGYICLLRDPDGNVIEFSHGQPINPRQLRDKV